MDKLLKQWNDSLNPETIKRLDANMERRSFLGNSIKAATSLALLPTISLFSACSSENPQTQKELSTVEPWATFAVVQEHLLPNDGNGPSASQVNATAYLKFVLEVPDTDPDDREFIQNGIDWLQDLSNNDYQKQFLACSHGEQDKLLHKISTSKAGERWLSYLLLYIFEALLSDPVYGGNPNGIGWQWLKHQPGFPTPPPNKRYQDLT